MEGFTVSHVQLGEQMAFLKIGQSAEAGVASIGIIAVIPWAIRLSHIRMCGGDAGGQDKGGGNASATGKVSDALRDQAEETHIAFSVGKKQRVLPITLNGYSDAMCIVRIRTNSDFRKISVFYVFNKLSYMSECFMQ
ncbi:hypothetical protein [Andreprevotia chitinilytica]|uniref:hypothetical protein n=1 Tax=Andreprevotia chitinilytica TaxID=396808 RepID=UPI0012EBE821|nr:hypothetical protein [Andreprevotia chitinilytica]